MMVTMAKKLNKSDPPPDRHRNTVMSFRPGKDLRSVIQSLAGLERRSDALMVQILLEEALKARGLWPPGQSN